jgi:hypothetical protein
MRPYGLHLTPSNPPVRRRSDQALKDDEGAAKAACHNQALHITYQFITDDVMAAAI